MAGWEAISIRISWVSKCKGAVHIVMRVCLKRVVPVASVERVVRWRDRQKTQLGVRNATVLCKASCGSIGTLALLASLQGLQGNPPWLCSRMTPPQQAYLQSHIAYAAWLGRQAAEAKLPSAWGRGLHLGFHWLPHIHFLGRPANSSDLLKS